MCWGAREPRGEWCSLKYRLGGLTGRAAGIRRRRDSWRADGGGVLARVGADGGSARWCRDALVELDAVSVGDARAVTLYAESFVNSNETVGVVSLCTETRLVGASGTKRHP